MVENDYPKARTNRVFVVNVVHGSPRDIFPCPPRRMTPLLPRTRGDSVDLFEREIKGLFPGKKWVPGEKFQKYAYTHTYIRIRKFHYCAY